MTDGQLAAVEAPDVEAVAGSVLKTFFNPAHKSTFWTLSNTNLTATLTGPALVTGTLAAVESPDVCLVAEVPLASGTLAAVESPDVCLVTEAPLASSGWGDHGTKMVLSTTDVTDDTATSTPSDWSSARGSRGYSTGKYYFEVKVLTPPPADIMMIGLIDAATANGAPMDDYNLINSAGTNGYNGNAQLDTTGGIAGGQDTGVGFSLSANDILGVAYDADNGFQYLSKNNVWYLSGDPTSGSSGTGHIAIYIDPFTMYPWVAIWGLVNGVLQLKTGSSSLTYSPPSGYSAWG